MNNQPQDTLSSVPISPPQQPQPQPIMNPSPHQVFGNYSPEGTLLPPNLPPGPIFSDDSLSWGFDDGLDNDHADMKRRRIARACDMCRKKKIKCDAKLPKCSHCESYNTECIFTHVEKKRAPPKGAKYIEGLENRLGRMEQLLRLSGVLGEDEKDGTADLGTLEQRLAKRVSSRNGSPTMSSDTAHSVNGGDSQGAEQRKSTPRGSSYTSPKTNEPSPVSQQSQKEPAVKKEEKDVDDLADMMWCSLVTNNHGETRFVGSSSGFSIFSPKGVQWVSEKTGDNSFHDMISAASKDDNKWYPWREEIFGDIFARKTFKPLPPYEECLGLITDFFQNFNQMFPLFHEPTFMHLVDKQYSTDPYDGSGWLASLNVALAIAYRIRAMACSLGGSRELEESKGWGYFKNALGVLSELTLRNTDLLSVQALIGMSLFLQGTPNPQPSFFLIGAALRLAHSIGLHKHGSGFGLNKAEVEQRKRVFWIAYLVDKDICLRSGRPPAQDDDDWSVDLPSENPDDGVGNVPLADGSKTNLFRTMCRFAVICSQVYNRLYSVKASRQSDGELLNTIGELDAELEQWKDSIPIDFRPEHEIKNLPTPLILHVVILHFAYYNCLTTIHRRSVHHGYWSSRLSDYAVQGRNVKPLNPRVFSSATLCVSAARTSIHLIQYIPPGDYACVWLILYYPVSALVTLFANILQNPQDARARSDLRLMNVVVTFLSTISLEESTGSLQRMCAVSREFERIAGVVLDKAEMEMTSRQKRKQEKEREKMEKGGAAATDLPQSQPQPQPQPQPRKSQDLKRPAEAFSRAQLGRLNGPGSISGSGSGSASATTSNVYTPDSFGTSDFAAQDASFNPLLAEQMMSSTGADGISNNSGAPSDFNNMPWFADASMSPNALSLQQPPQPISPSGIPPSPQTGPGGDAFSPYPTTGTGTGTNTTFPSDIMGSDAGSNAFQQPFVPQDLWQMPMTFEWDWADMSGMPFETPTAGMGMGWDAMGRSGGTGAGRR